jgi:hypothetical protein
MQAGNPHQNLIAMRQIDHDMCAAIKSRQSANLGNTRVTQNTTLQCGEVWLYQTRIARFSYANGLIELQSGSHTTETTKRRLNALLDTFTNSGGGQGIYTEAGQWYWKKGEKWDQEGVIARFLV